MTSLPVFVGKILGFIREIFPGQRLKQRQNLVRIVEKSSKKQTESWGESREEPTQPWIIKLPFAVTCKAQSHRNLLRSQQNDLEAIHCNNRKKHGCSCCHS
jgi:hypothetical protein